MYFGVEQEKQVKQYLHNRDSQFYQDHIHKLLRKIAYGMSGKMNMKPKTLYQSPAVRDSCTSHLWEQLLLNYNPDSGRAYSYLTRVAHNYYCGVWKTYHRKHRTLYRTHQEIDRLFDCMHEPAQRWNITGQIGNVERLLVDKDVEKIKDDAAKEALSIVETTAGRFNSTKRCRYSLKVCEATRILFENADGLSLDEDKLHKKQLYLYLRELTGLTTKQIVPILKKMRQKYNIYLRENL